MKRLRVSVVEYLNTAPLIWGMWRGSQRDQFDLDFTVPSACARALETRQADVGILPSIAYQRIEGLRVIPNIAIAAKHEVRSVLLASRKPAEEVRSVALDSSSRTSAALVRILFRKLWLREPSYVERTPDAAAMLAECDAALLIGDPALKLERRELNVYDLAREWWRLTGKGFVFAFWAAQPEKATPEVTEAFTASRAYGLAHLEEIADEMAPRLELSRELILNYFRENVDFSLDESNLAGLELFYRWAHELGLVPQVRALEFI